MSRPYLLDENLSDSWRTEPLRREPSLVMWAAGDPGVPARGTPDPDALAWCETRSARPVTNNRKSKPGHSTDHPAAGRHVPGIFPVPNPLPFGATLDDLLHVAPAGRPDDDNDQIVRPPFPNREEGR